jgi:hypothetical protein
LVVVGHGQDAVQDGMIDTHLQSKHGWLRLASRVQEDDQNKKNKEQKKQKRTRTRR